MMLRIAIPKGRLHDQVVDRLIQAGMMIWPSTARCYDLAVSWKNNGLIEFAAKVVKPRAIPQLIALGNFQIGFCGLDLIVDYNCEGVITPLINLGLNTVRIVAAVPKVNRNILSNPPKRPLVIATEYENLAAKWAIERGLAHIIVQTWGSTEGYAPNDADIVFDCTETGETINANGLIVVDEIMVSSTWLIANTQAMNDLNFQQDIEQLRLKFTEGFSKSKE